MTRHYGFWSADNWLTSWQSQVKNHTPEATA